MAARSLADTDPLDAGGDQIEHAGADERVMEDHVGGGDQAFGLAREQIGVARAGAYQPDGAGQEVMRHERNLP